jgi:hypothetical protein
MGGFNAALFGALGTNPATTKAGGNATKERQSSMEHMPSPQQMDAASTSAGFMLCPVWS